MLRRRSLFFLLASLGLLVVGGASAASSTGARATARFESRRVLDTATSSNWAGYVATAPATTAPGLTTFTDVAGTWVQPRLTCSAGEVGAAAFWVGLGGSEDSSPALEQTGTEGDCSRSGKASYSAWYELVPAGPVTVKLKVRPGDRMTGAVLVSGTKVTVSLKNLTTKKRFSKTFSSVSPLDTSSAEWIAEAPSLCPSNSRCTVMPLPNFGTAPFTKAAAVANGHPGTISDPAWSFSQFVLAPDPAAPAGRGVSANSHGATPSSVSADGRSFAVSWEEAPSPSG